MSSSLPSQGQVPPPAEGCTDLFLQVLLVPSLWVQLLRGRGTAQKWNIRHIPLGAACQDLWQCAAKLGGGEWLATLPETSTTPSRGLP